MQKIGGTWSSCFVLIFVLLWTAFIWLSSFLATNDDAYDDPNHNTTLLSSLSDSTRFDGWMEGRKGRRKERGKRPQYTRYSPNRNLLHLETNDDRYPLRSALLCSSDSTAFSRYLRSLLLPGSPAREKAAEPKNENDLFCLLLLPRASFYLLLPDMRRTTNGNGNGNETTF